MIQQKNKKLFENSWAGVKTQEGWPDSAARFTADSRDLCWF